MPRLSAVGIPVLPAQAVAKGQGRGGCQISLLSGMAGLGACRLTKAPAGWCHGNKLHQPHRKGKGRMDEAIRRANSWLMASKCRDALNRSLAGRWYPRPVKVDGLRFGRKRLRGAVAAMRGIAAA